MRPPSIAPPPTPLPRDARLESLVGEAVRTAPLDPRDAFILGLVDRHPALEEIVDISGMSEEDVGEIVGRLIGLGLVAVAVPRKPR